MRPSDSVSLYISLAVHYNRIANDSAVMYIHKVKQVLREETDPRLKLDLLAAEQRYLRNFGKYVEAKNTNIRRIRLARLVQNRPQLFIGYANLASCYMNLRKADSAEHFYKLAKKRSVRVEDPLLLGEFYKSLGWFYMEEGKLRLSMENKLKALSYFEESGDLVGIGDMYGQIGGVLFETEKYKEAIVSFEKAIAYGQKTGKLITVQLAMYNLTNTYFRLGNYEKAMQMGKETEKVARVIKTPSVLAETYKILGLVFSKEQNRKNSQAYFFKALRLYRTLEDYSNQIRVLWNLAYNYKELGDLEKAKETNEKALNIGRKEEDFAFRMEIFKLRSQLDSLEGNYLPALKNYQRYTAIKDSVKKEVDFQKLGELEVLHNTLEKEKEILALNSENREQLLLLKAQRYQNYLLWGALVLFVVCAAGFYWMFKTKKENNRLLSLKNMAIGLANKSLVDKGKELHLALQDKDVLIKEIHHRVKNNFQLVISLLRLQANRLEDEKIDFFVMRSQNRIQAMSLIHELLYSSDNMEEIDFQRYLTELLDAVHYTFGFTKKDISYQIDAKGFRYNIDTAVPLAIVINELVNNAFKHGFKGRSKGSLTIKLFKRNGQDVVVVEDDGVGIKEDQTEKKTSYGLTLVNVVVKQLRGTLEKTSTNGTKYALAFSSKKENL